MPPSPQIIKAAIELAEAYALHDVINEDWKHAVDYQQRLAAHRLCELKYAAGIALRNAFAKYLDAKEETP